MSFSIVIGRSGGIYFARSNGSIRLCLWFVAFTLSFYDTDKAYERCLKLIKKLEAEHPSSPTDLGND